MPTLRKIRENFLLTDSEGAPLFRHAHVSRSPVFGFVSEAPAFYLNHLDLSGLIFFCRHGDFACFGAGIYALNAQLPSRKIGTRSPLFVTPVMFRSSVPIMKSTWIIESLTPIAFSCSSE